MYSSSQENLYILYIDISSSLCSKTGHRQGDLRHRLPLHNPCATNPSRAAVCGHVDGVGPFSVQRLPTTPSTIVKTFWDTGLVSGRTRLAEGVSKGFHFLSFCGSETVDEPSCCVASSPRPSRFSSLHSHDHQLVPYTTAGPFLSFSPIIGVTS